MYKYKAWNINLPKKLVESYSMEAKIPDYDALREKADDDFEGRSAIVERGETVGTVVLDRESSEVPLNERGLRNTDWVACVNFDYPPLEFRGVFYKDCKGNVLMAIFLPGTTDDVRWLDYYMDFQLIATDESFKFFGIDKESYE